MGWSNPDIDRDHCPSAFDALSAYFFVLIKGAWELCVLDK